MGLQVKVVAVAALAAGAAGFGVGAWVFGGQPSAASPGPPAVHATATTSQSIPVPAVATPVHASAVSVTAQCTGVAAAEVIYTLPDIPHSYVVNTTLNGKPLTSWYSDPGPYRSPSIIGLPGGAGTFTVTADGQQATVIVPQCP